MACNGVLQNAAFLSIQANPKTHKQVGDAARSFIADSLAAEKMRTGSVLLKLDNVLRAFQKQASRRATSIPESSSGGYILSFKTRANEFIRLNGNIRFFHFAFIVNTMTRHCDWSRDVWEPPTFFASPESNESSCSHSTLQKNLFAYK